MPSLADNVVLFLLALLLFGPKKLPKLAREVGKWVGEFRRASADFRMQMEDEMRVSEQADKQKKIDELVAANPAADPARIPEPEHPHTPVHAAEDAPHADAQAEDAAPVVAPEPVAAPQPIATSGEISMMPPASGLPVGRTSSTAAPADDAEAMSDVFDSIPVAAAPGTAEEVVSHG